MKPSERGAHQFHCLNKHNGFVLTIIIVLIAAVISVAVIKTALSSLSRLESSSSASLGKAAQYSMESCIQEALLQLRRDSNYFGGIVEFGGITCQIVVAPKESLVQNIDITAAFGEYSHIFFTIPVILDPFGLNL